MHRLVHRVRSLLQRQPRLPTPPVIDPRVTPATIRSRALGTPKQFFVYTPPRTNGRQPLPVLYLFRGHEREWIDPAQDQSRGGRTVIDVYEELLNAGTIGPMLLVFPGISSDDHRVPGLLVDFLAPHLTDAPGIGSGKFAEYFLQEMVPHVERHFGAAPQARGVDGFSLGGFMAVKIALQRPSAFRSVGAFDGLYFWDDRDDAQVIAAEDATFLNPLFDPAFGVPRDRRYAAAHNPLNLVRRSDRDTLKHLTWLIEYGPEQGEPQQANFYRGERLCALLTERGIENSGRGAIPGALHNWRNADDHMRYVLPYHWAALDR